MNDYEKEKTIHDYIVSNIAYDTDLINYTAYDALTQGKAVCQGFSLLTYRMMQDVGIETRIVDGIAGGESHVWNEVKLDGEWYHLDTTWDDPIPFVQGRVLYSYFNVTDDVLRKDHSWQSSSFPVASTDFLSVLQSKVESDLDNDDTGVFNELLDAIEQ
jgi:transglutaminase/protease-like cytokinesis protein 3